MPYILRIAAVAALLVIAGLGLAQAQQGAEALLQLAFRDEFEARDQEAVSRYAAIASSMRPR